MNELTNEYVAQRCSIALMDNKDYMAIESSNSLSDDEIQEIAETICYRKGWNDAIDEAKRQLSVSLIY